MNWLPSFAGSFLIIFGLAESPGEARSQLNRFRRDAPLFRFVRLHRSGFRRLFVRHLGDRRFGTYGLAGWLRGGGCRLNGIGWHPVAREDLSGDRRDDRAPILQFDFCDQAEISVGTLN